MKRAGIGGGEGKTREKGQLRRRRGWEGKREEEAQLRGGGGEKLGQRGEKETQEGQW